MHVVLWILLPGWRLWKGKGLDAMGLEMVVEVLMVSIGLILKQNDRSNVVASDM